MSGRPTSVGAEDPISLDLITVGRVNLDLYSQQIGAPFAEAAGFEGMVGGTPTNIAIGTARLGLRSAAFTAVGEDQVGDLILHRLACDGVSTRFVLRKRGYLSSLALLGVEPPDHFPLLFYRTDPADIHLTIKDAAALPLADHPAFGKCFQPGRLRASLPLAGGGGTSTGHDLVPGLGYAARRVARPARLRKSDAEGHGQGGGVIGTEEELWAALSPDPGPSLPHGRLGEGQRRATEEMISDLAAGAGGPSAVVLKRGPIPPGCFTPTAPVRKSLVTGPRS